MAASRVPYSQTVFSTPVQAPSRTVGQPGQTIMRCAARPACMLAQCEAIEDSSHWQGMQEAVRLTDAVGCSDNNLCNGDVVACGRWIKR